MRLRYLKMRIMNRSVSIPNFWMVQIFGWSAVYVSSLLFYYYKLPMQRIEDFVAHFATYFSGFLVTTLLRLYFRQIDYESKSLVSLSLIIVIPSFIAANGMWLLDAVLTNWVNHTVYALNRALQNYSNSLFFCFPIVISWSGLYFLIKLWDAWNRERKRAETASALAQSAQLRMLRYQLNPHFLFNSLNSIRALVDEDRQNAKRMITELSEFLRYSLISKSDTAVALRDELDAIRHYFAIEKRRFEQKLDVEFDIEPEAEDYPVLSFLIHPLVENAVKYGMQTSAMPLKIRINAVIRGDSLRIDVANTGKWIRHQSHGADHPGGTGTGLDNVKNRLENAFPGNHYFRVKEKEGMVHIQIGIFYNGRAETLLLDQSPHR